MVKNIARTAAVAVSVIVLSMPVCAQFGSKKAYDATYDVKTSTNTTVNTTMRMVSDGQGHERQEISGMNGAQGMVSILDYPGKMMYTLIEAQKMVMKAPLRLDQVRVTDAESAKARGAKPLGVKLIDGHPCHGYSYSSPTGNSECWIGDDVGVVVMTNSQGQGSSSTMKLVKFSAFTPNPALFVVPPGYKTMELPQSAQGY